MQCEKRESPMKEIKNLEKSLATLLKIKNLPNNEDESYLISTCNKLMSKPLKDYNVENLRIMIGQDIGLQFLIPIAIEILNKNILAEGDYYEGDLLKSVLTSDEEYWKSNYENWISIINIYNQNQENILNSELTWELKKKLKSCFEIFKSYN